VAAPPPLAVSSPTPVAPEGSIRKWLRRLNEDYAGILVIVTLFIAGATGALFLVGQLDKIKSDHDMEHAKLEEEIAGIRKYIEGNQATEFHEFNNLCLKEKHRIDYNNKLCIDDDTGQVTQFEYYQPGTATASTPKAAPPSRAQAPPKPQPSAVSKPQ
jgi:hypothetical protein